jgi:hypothetical protein
VYPPDSWDPQDQILRINGTDTHETGNGGALLFEDGEGNGFVIVLGFRTDNYGRISVTETRDTTLAETYKRSQKKEKTEDPEQTPYLQWGRFERSRRIQKGKVDVRLYNERIRETVMFAVEVLIQPETALGLSDKGNDAKSRRDELTAELSRLRLPS